MEKYTANKIKPYSPKAKTTQGNKDSWATVQASLKSGPKTVAQLQAKLEKRNHANFVGYAVRRGWLVATK